MAAFRPKYLTFDCYGTLLNFQMSHMTSTMVADRLAPERLQAFTTDFSAYLFDEVLGEWKPYADVITAAWRRCCTRWGVPYHEAEAQQLYEPIPTWAHTLTSRPDWPKSRSNFHSSSCRTPLTSRSTPTSKSSVCRFMPCTRPSRRRPINPGSRRLNT